MRNANAAAGALGSRSPLSFKVKLAARQRGALCAPSLTTGGSGSPTGPIRPSSLRSLSGPALSASAPQASHYPRWSSSSLTTDKDVSGQAASPLRRRRAGEAEGAAGDAPAAPPAVFTGKEGPIPQARGPPNWRAARTSLDPDR